MSSETTPAKITVLFLLYHAPSYVRGLVAAIARQRHPDHDRQEEWLEVVFMDNGSTDDTGKELADALAGIGAPAHYRIVTNPVNLGYARAVNKAFEIARTPYVLTCHCDCLFGSDDYVARMLDLLHRHKDAGTITGQPAVPDHKPIPFAEKVNLVAYLMDIFPVATEKELVPVGFSEGRCDGFRVAAVAAAGYYDTSHHSAGEDQLLCASMRAQGFRVFQAPHLRYFLSVSDEQDTVWKLVKHLRLFGEKHPILVLRGGAATGVVGGQAGANRRARMLLRATQLVGALVYPAALGGALAGIRPLLFAAPLLALFLAKALVFRRHIQAVRFSLGELLAFALLQPALDIAYAAGFVRGIGIVLAARWAEWGRRRPA